MFAPVEKKEGTLVVAVEDPYDLTRLDAFKAMNLAPRHDFVVGLKGDILEYISATYGASAAIATDGQDLGRIITALGSGEEDEMAEPEPDPLATPEIDETDSGIVRLCNQIIVDAYNKGASDIHVEPYGKNARPPWCGCGSTATARSTSTSVAPPQRRGPAVQDHGQAG